VNLRGNTVFAVTTAGLCGMWCRGFSYGTRSTKTLRVCCDWHL